ncbi:MAG: glycosyltransferase family 4 protein [Lachnospiraceae bacterium]|nr:glycosyltransferase family 4 protein [Lachnospiraceae bacterium]
MKKILIVTGNYLPGYKDGGPIRSLENLTEALGDAYEFYIMASDRDLGEDHPYAQLTRDHTLEYNTWNRVENAYVWYVKDGIFRKKEIEELSRDKDLIYFTSFYREYGRYILSLKKEGKLEGKPVVIASMGVFSQGALQIKAFKKKCYITLLKTLGYFKGIIWSVTSEREEEELKKVIGQEADCRIAEDLPRKPIPLPAHTYEPDRLKIVFLSRIVDKKNLEYACRVLTEAAKHTDGRLLFHIYGPREDRSYWEKCEKILDQSPLNIEWEYRGEVPAEQVPMVLAGYDVFLFPTKGENYGHVIYEALMAGCIPVISDQTPWEDFRERELGYVEPLSEISATNGFVKAIVKLAAASGEQKEQWSGRGIQYAADRCEKAYKDTGYRRIFDL